MSTSTRHPPREPVRADAAARHRRAALRSHLAAARARGAGVRGAARRRHDRMAGPRLSRSASWRRRSAGRPMPSASASCGWSARSPPTGRAASAEAIWRACARCCRCSRWRPRPPPCALIHAGLLAAYLGEDPATRVLAGTVQRGEVQGVEAVLFFTDLRGFTALADTLPGRDLIALLDDCFDCMVRPVVARGGEVLKFLGDGLLAIFRIEDRPRAETCAVALEAAKEALALMDWPGRDAPRPVAADARPRHRPACRPRQLRQRRRRRAARLHGDRTRRQRGLAHRAPVRRARPPSRDLAGLCPGGRGQPPSTGVAWPPSPARRARGDGAVRPGVSEPGVLAFHDDRTGAMFPREAYVSSSRAISSLIDAHSSSD